MTHLSQDSGDTGLDDLRRRRLTLWCSLGPIAVFVVSLYLMSFTSVLDGLAFGPVSWAVLVAVAQFVVAVAVGHIYVSRSTALDADHSSTSREREV